MICAARNHREYPSPLTAQGFQHILRGTIKINNSPRQNVLGGYDLNVIFSIGTDKYMNRIIFILLVVLPHFAVAYQCPLEDAYFKEIVYGEYQNADLVAILEPTKILSYELEDEYSWCNLVYAKIIKSWKNADRREIIIKDVKSMISGYLPLDEDKEYIVYAYGPDEEGFYEAFTCDIETLGDVTDKHKSILNKIQSNRLKIVNYYSVFSRLRGFINNDLIQNLNVISIGNSVRVTIELNEYTDDWVKDSVIRFIKQEGIALGIENVGEFSVSIKNEKTTISWVHPKN